MTHNSGDPGQVAPGTQTPIKTFFVVSMTEYEPVVGEYSVGDLSNLMGGTLKTGKAVEDEYSIFTDRTSADDFAKRQELLHRAAFYLQQLTAEELVEVVPALGPGRVENTIESINRYVE